MGAGQIGAPIFTVVGAGVPTYTLGVKPPSVALHSYERNKIESLELSLCTKFVLTTRVMKKQVLGLIV